ncbi:uncharacterized protein G2W53_036059 [Senna tora]|uniref:Uncharacterized protein n=1 Tax=Senna tora TaxID=362788 RepID=A0A834W8A9_9FABA|nr:uncharacterized protein G2W53_036059 [Senna tora]
MAQLYSINCHQQTKRTEKKIRTCDTWRTQGSTNIQGDVGNGKGW